MPFIFCDVVYGSAGASGWNDANVGHVIDIHNYEDANAVGPNGTRASVLGEFGGLGMVVDGHLLVSLPGISVSIEEFKLCRD